MTDAPVRYEPGHVTRIVLDRPERKNALDARCWELLDEHLRRFEEDPEARVLVVTGAGDEFCAGADKSGGITGSAEAVASKMREIAGIVERLHAMPKPVLARVDGVAVGVGLSVALACDVVLSSDRARLGAVFSRLGLVPDGGLSWLLPRLVGPQRAKELVLTGRLVSASEACRLGLVTEVVAADDLDDATARWAEQLATCPPVPAAEALRLLDQSWTTTYTEALQQEASAQQVAVAALGR